MYFTGAGCQKLWPRKVARASQQERLGRGHFAPKQLHYCNICLFLVDKNPIALVVICGFGICTPYRGMNTRKVYFYEEFSDAQHPIREPA